MIYKSVSGDFLSGTTVVITDRCLCFFSILFYFLFLIVSWSHRQSQVDFSIFWYVRKFNLHNTRMFCWFFQTCCQFQAASAVTVILDLFSFGLANACVNHLCNICAQTDEHTMQNLPSHKFSHLLSVCQNVPYTKYELFDFWSCSCLFEKWKWWYKNIHKIIKAFSKHFL